MSMKSSKLSKPVKIAHYDIDILAVYPSENEIPVTVDEAMTRVQELLSGKKKGTKSQIKKCIMDIWTKNNEPFTIEIKSHKNKKIMEVFTVKSVGTPQVGQIHVNKNITRSLVFLPVLNKDNKSELFVFHPNNATAQEVVIKLVKLLQIKEAIYQKSIASNSPSPPKSETEEVNIKNSIDLDQTDHGNKRENTDQIEINSEYSLSPVFLKNWYNKVENMVSITPNSLYQSWDFNLSSNGLNEDLFVLNQNLKEIRAFMNKLYVLMNQSVTENKIQSKHQDYVVKLPSKSNFIEIINKIKSSLNLAAFHESIITTPSAKDIVNQLLLILRILGDATKDVYTKDFQFLKDIIEPLIHDKTVQYLQDNLNIINKDFWMLLGENYGYIRILNPIGLNRTIIDEFQIKKTFLSPKDDKKYNRSEARSADRNSIRHYDTSSDIGLDRPLAKSERDLNQTHAREFEDNADRNYSNPYYKYDDEENDRYFEKNVPKHQYQIYQPKISKSDFSLEDDVIHRNYLPLYEPERQTPHLHDSGILMHQRSGKKSENQNGFIHPNTSTWNDRQCRFIDAVRLRNGRLMKIVRDRPAQNKREISVSCNEVVELLTDYGDMFSAKNALGEVGYCPSSIAENVTTSPF